MAEESHFNIYKNALKKAWEDGIITADENFLLVNLRESLNISDDLHSKLEEEIRGIIPKDRPGLAAYKAALEQAWLDKIVTNDERAILEKLKLTLDISDEEQMSIESEIRQKIILNQSTDDKPNTPNQQQSVSPKATLSRVQPANQSSGNGQQATKKQFKDVMNKKLMPEKGLNNKPPNVHNLKGPVEKNNLNIRIKVPSPKPQRNESPAPPPPEKLAPSDDSAFWLNQGEIIFKKSNGNVNLIEEAIKHFDKAIEIEPLNFLAWSNKGLGLKILNRFDDALLCYDRALTLSPDHINSWFNKAVLLGCMNRFEEAASCYRKVLELDSNNELARRDLQIIEQMKMAP